MNEEKLWESYNNLLMSNDIDRVRKLITRYELFKKTLDVPGSIAECGVFKGAGWFYWLKLLAIYAPGERKFVYGFDTFKGFSEELLEYEKDSAKGFVKEAEFNGINPDELLDQAVEYGLNNGKLVQGEVSKTIPEFAEKNQGIRFSLINLDFDTYEGTKVALERFTPLMSPGGIIILDEYGKEGWGESDAVDEYILKHGFKIKSVRYSSQPSAYIQIPKI
jgi:hypothetical protein